MTKSRATMCAETTAFYQAVPSRIRRCREACALTQQELATVLGLHVDSVRGWESGRKRPRFEHLYAMATTLEIPLTRLLFDAWQGPVETLPMVVR